MTREPSTHDHRPTSQTPPPARCRRGRCAYDRPQFTDDERAYYFELNSAETAHLQTFSDGAVQAFFVLQLGYFKAKQRFFSFTLADVFSDLIFIVNHLDFGVAPDDLRLPNRRTSQHQRQIILEYVRYRHAHEQEREIGGAWPEAEIVLVEDYTDIARWMERCAVSTAPSVIAIISQSLTSPGRITWTTAVQPVDEGLIEVPDLEAEGEPISDEQGRTIAVKDAQGAIITKLEHQYRFYCPDCGRMITDIPRGEASVTAQVDVDTDIADAQDHESLAPVGDIAHFLTKRRWCLSCGGALWTKAYIDAVAATYPSLPFAEWSAAMDAIERKGGMIFVPRKRGHARLARATDGPIVAEQRTPAPISTWDTPSAERRVNARRETIRQAQLARHPVAADPRYALAAVSPTSWSPFDYMKQFYAGCCAFLGVDESHNTRGDNSDIARAIARAKRASQSTCYASGTH
jgi:predicted RNA-binding Zn-ribbon protein involved in translation (DUF1610 family)